MCKYNKPLLDLYNMLDCNFRTVTAHVFTEQQPVFNRLNPWYAVIIIIIIFWGGDSEAMYRHYDVYVLWPVAVVFIYL